MTLDNKKIIGILEALPTGGGFCLAAASLLRPGAAVVFTNIDAMNTHEKPLARQNAGISAAIQASASAYLDTPRPPACFSHGIPAC